MQQAEMTRKIELIRKISQRLFIALVVLILIGSSLLTLTILKENDTVWTPLMPVFIGAGGGLIALQRRLKQFSMEDLELLSSSWIYITLPPFVSGLLAFVLYVIFLSDLLGGKLFPHFEPEPWTTGQHTECGFCLLFKTQGHAEDYAKLIFWSFVAGFSERFVIDIINRFERGANRDA